MPDHVRISCAGEAALIVYLGEESSPAISARVQQLAELLPGALGTTLIDLVPSYASLLVIFDPLQSDHFEVASRVRETAGAMAETTATSGRLVEIPVYYAPESGADLESIAQRAKLSCDEVIAIHSQTEYRVYAIGFAPGFAYLGEVDERIAAPRLSTPRQRVPRGAVAIADRQTAVYPAVSPGGWNLIGRSPLRMFDPAAQSPMLVSVGDRVRFQAVDRQEFLSMGGEL
ncbi:MAG: KipI family sensor histidine kinase inhibitor [Halieaceae bacterium]|jgi:KipI family sensor histidine kinase inhibitor